MQNTLKNITKNTAKNTFNRVLLLLILCLSFPASVRAEASVPHAELVCYAAELTSYYSAKESVYLAAEQISCEQKQTTQNIISLIQGTWALVGVASMCDPTIVLSKVALAVGEVALSGLQVYVSNWKCYDRETDQQIEERIKATFCDIYLKHGEPCSLEKIKIQLHGESL